MNIIVYLIGLIFFMPFAAVILYEIIIKKKKHSVKVKAELLSVEHDDGCKGGDYGVYRYNYQGKEYTCKTSFMTARLLHRQALKNLRLLCILMVYFQKMRNGLRTEFCLLIPKIHRA